MQVNPKIRKANSRSKRREAMLMGFKLIINNQGQFITEIKNYPLDKVSLHFSLSVTSNGNEEIFLFNFEILFKRSSLLADAATCHPSFANFKAKAFPIPLLAPVIQIFFIKNIIYFFKIYVMFNMRPDVHLICDTMLVEEKIK